MSDDATISQLDRLRKELAELRSKSATLEAEIEALESIDQLSLRVEKQVGIAQTPNSPAEKIALFLNLFGTRRDVYPRRWENKKTNRSGYSPACSNEWQNGICRKPQIKCSECPHQRFLPLDARAIDAHLRGTEVLGVYAITEANTCRFLAADFDGDGWMANVSAYREAGAKTGIQIAVERSRSGNGAHAWIFFSELVPATIARGLGCILLAKATAKCPSMAIGAFDRFFPNQDTILPGGFGNLIALPLAKHSRNAGNTLFLDDHLRPIPDQWQFLALQPRYSAAQVSDIIARISPLLAPSVTPQDTSEAPDLVLQMEEATLDLSSPLIRKGLIQGELTLRLDSQIHIPRSIPVTVLAALKRLGTFANPVFQEKLRLRFPIYGTPRFLFAGEWQADRLVLPRGTLEPCIRILEDAGAEVSIHDQREKGTRISWTFAGELRPEQQHAVRAMEQHDIGVLCAPPGSGKTVMGCALIARHRTAVLVLVHRAILLDQWKETAMTFLGLKKKEIGVWRGSKPRLTHRFDIAMLPSLSRAADYATAFAGYGLIIVDECHHVPAATFELLLKACPSRRIVGLTATPQRKDHLEKLMHLQCGPIRHILKPTEEERQDRRVFVRRIMITMPHVQAQAPIHEIWDALVADESRLKRIVADIAECIGDGRCPLVLADRKLYLDRLEAALSKNPSTAGVPRYRLESGVNKKSRTEILQKIDAHYLDEEPFVLLATASLVGEGFDLPQLDTLVLAMPLSFKGRLIQYAGRLHRNHEGKAPARIYDYLDDNNPLTRAMYQRRSAGYRQMGYMIEMESEHTAGLFEDGTNA